MDTVTGWRTVMAAAGAHMDAIARFAPVSTRDATASHPAPQTSPALPPALDADPPVPQSHRDVGHGDPVEPSRVAAQHPHADASTDLHSLKDPSDLATDGAKGGFANYIHGSLDALGQIPRDLGDLLSEPGQIPEALASILPAIAPEAEEALKIVLAPLSFARTLDDEGRTNGVPPDSFTGNSRNQYQAPEGTPSRNAPGTIGNTPISGHALDQAQNRGVPYSVIEQALRNGRVTPDLPGTVRIYDPENKITIFQNSETGNIITLRMGK